MSFRIAKSAPARRVFLRKKKSKAAQDVLDQLNSYIEAGQAEPTYWLTRMWDDQQNAITYKELREAIQNGSLSKETLAAWQIDYSNFVNNTMKPLWIDSMSAAAANAAKNHPDYFFDPMTTGVRDWINVHGSEWITQIGTEQQDAISAMLRKTYSGEWSVDELARAIRPTIGLTKPQSEATLNYYQHVKATIMDKNPKMKEATAAKQAQTAAAKYAERQHRARAYTIATTEMAYAYNKGADEGIRQAQQQGLMGMTEKVWSTAADDGVCQICAALEGQVVGMDGDFNFKGKELYAGQKQTPPAHPRCRCALEYREVSPPKIMPEATPDANTQIQPWKSQDSTAVIPAPEPETPSVPASLPLPTSLTHDGKANLGGTGEMHAYTDGTGQQWLFKPAQNKSGGAEAFRAYVQESGYKVQSIVDPDSAVEVSVGNVDGKFGAIQKRISTTNGTDLKAWQHGTDQLPDGIAPQLQRENVTDWLLGNYDSHGGNFIVDDTGKLIGVDKEQALKYMKQPTSAKMSYAYHPNATYGETEPIYNTMYRRFAKGEIDLNLQDTLPYIKRMETIPDAEYREIFRDYAESLYGKGKQAENLLDAIVERKATLRETYRTFYSELLTERTGAKQSFVWADEATSHLQQPIAAVQMTPSTLKQMNISELKQLAKQKQVAYYNNMNKSQLITSISDPVKAPEMSAQVRDRLTANEAARKAAAAVPAKEKAAAKATDIFTDLSCVPETRLGIPVQSDGGSVEGLNLTARRMNIGGKDFYEVSGKLTYEEWSSTWNSLKPFGVTDELTYEQADDVLKLFSETTKVDLGISVRSIKVQTPTGTFEMYIDGQSRRYTGLRGYFRARVETAGAGAVDADNMRQVFQSVGLDKLTVNPTAADELLLKKTRLVWQNAPARMKELQGLNPGAESGKISAKLDAIIKQEKLDVSQLSKMKTVEVYPGYTTVVSEGVSDVYKKAGLEHVWTGVRDADSVVKIVKSPGLSSTNSRNFQGMKVTGSSPVRDMETGGSDSVFTRVGVKGTTKGFDDCYGGHTYRIIIDPKEMERTDWYAHCGDEYGISDGPIMESRLPATDFIKQMNSSYSSGNEIMFRHGISKDSFIGISCENSALRADLLKKMKAEGITEINGTPIEKFVRVSQKIAKP